MVAGGPTHSTGHALLAPLSRISSSAVLTAVLVGILVSQYAALHMVLTIQYNTSLPALIQNTIFTPSSSSQWSSRHSPKEGGVMFQDAGRSNGPADENGTGGPPEGKALPRLALQLIKPELHGVLYNGVIDAEEIERHGPANHNHGAGVIDVDRFFNIAAHHSAEYDVITDAIAGKDYRRFMARQLSSSPKKDLLPATEGTSPQVFDFDAQLTICTQASLSGVKELIAQARAFSDGPISAAIFLEEDIVFSIAYLSKIITCFDLRNVGFHLVLQRDARSEYVAAADPNLELISGPCKDIVGLDPHPDTTQKKSKQSQRGRSAIRAADKQHTDLSALQLQNYNHKLPFPNNVLRNVAVARAMTPFVTVLDVDIVPSAMLAKAALRATRLTPKHEIGQTVFVLPAFEVREGKWPLPKTRDTLLSWAAAGDAQPFYRDLCWKCHKHTRYDLWEKKEENSLLYEVEWKDAYEPFYVVQRDALIRYDERFKQYGFNRISQVCETNIAGYSFKVLYDGFVLHQGFKVHGQFHASKEAELTKNRALYHQFQDELAQKYPSSERTCRPS